MMKVRETCACLDLFTRYYQMSLLMLSLKVQVIDRPCLILSQALLVLTCKITDNELGIWSRKNEKIYIFGICGTR